MSAATNIWLRLADWVGRPDRADWLSAMGAELTGISTVKEQNRFARGCFLAVLMDRVFRWSTMFHTTRYSIAGIIAGISVFGMWSSSEVAELGGYGGVPYICGVLCFSYLIASVLLVRSLNGLIKFSVTGLIIALTSWFSLSAGWQGVETIPRDFLVALSLETVVIMGVLLLLGLSFKGFTPVKSRHEPIH